MTAKDAITKLTVMLGLNTQEVVPTTETVEAQFAEATLVDGTVVKTEGDLVEGATLYVVTPEGDVLAPFGTHQTEGGQLVTVDEMGLITKIEDMAAEAPATPATEVAMEDVVVTQEGVEVPQPEIVASITDEVVTAIADLIAPALDEISSLKEEIAMLQQNFSSFKNEPAGKKITNNLVEFKQNEQTFMDSRYEAIKKIRNGKN